MKQQFQREDRYLVFKRKDLANLPEDIKDKLDELVDRMQPMIPARSYVVVESDWPEYEQVWEMIEQRINGITGEAQPAEQANGRDAVAVFKGRRLTPFGTREFWGWLADGVEDLPDGAQLYTTPPAQPAREWVGLTNQRTRELITDYFDAHWAINKATGLLEQFESELREKNAGQPAADADPNAPWLTEAHILCTDHGIPMGHITERIRALREKLAADDKAGGEPVAWADKAMELATDFAIESLRLGDYQTRQNLVGYDKWKINMVREKREAARERLRQYLYTRPQPQAEAVSPDKAQNFYLAVCNFLVWIGREGIVHADDPIIDQLSNALHDIDGGVFKDSLKWPQAEVRVPEKKK